jgi:hypothetical protein
MNPAKIPHPGITARIVFLSPALARNLIDSNSENQRNVSRINLDKVSGSIRNGSFALNGESMIVSDTGRMLDGQHRALAVMNTGIGVWTVLVEGVPDEHFATINSGKSRSYTNVLQIAGEGAATHLSSTVQRLAEYLSDPKSIGTGTAFSHADLERVRSMEPTLSESCSAASRNKLLSASRGAWLYHLAHRVNPSFTDSFFDSLSTGEMLRSDSPIYRLRERIIVSRETRRIIQLRECMALLIKAWNCTVERKAVKVLRWTDAEQFPVLNLDISPISNASNLGR